MAHSKAIWVRCVLAYTTAGAVAATFVGLALGQIGRWVDRNYIANKLYFISLLSLLLAMREWGWISFRLPERRRQTEKVWAHQFGFVVASAMWGFHIGLGFTTWATFGGFWIVVALALALANPLYAGLLMLVYWLGRALPVWLAPGLLDSPSLAVELPAEILRDHSSYRRMAGLVLAWSSAAAILMALQVQVPLPFNFGAWR